jgi:predicted outer membrane protein
MTRQQRHAQAAAQVQAAGTPAGQRAVWHNPDHTMASCVAIENQEEVALAKFAQDKAKNKEVKDFASMIAKDHQDFLQKLRRFAPEAAEPGFLSEQTQTQAQASPAAGAVQQAGGAAREPSRVQQTAGTQNAPHQGLDMLEIHREVAEECLNDAKRELGKKDGAEFDECFIGMQIGKHHGMKDKLVVFERYASPELKQVLAEGLSTTEKHLKKAEEIKKSLDTSSDSSKSSDSKK